MHAAVCNTFNDPLIIEELDLRAPRGNEIRVAMRACAICHSDISLTEGIWGGYLPAVYGHEAAGIVDAVGPEVSEFRVGDHVVATLLYSCGQCHACGLDAPYLCEVAFPEPEAGPLRRRDGEPVWQGMGIAALAEAAVVDASQAVVIPSEMAFESASLLGCGVITGAGAVYHAAGVAHGESVAVMGCGGVGLNAIQAARIAGAEPIIALDPNPKKREVAVGLGATAAIDPTQPALREAVLKLTASRGVDHLVVAVGVKSAVEIGPTLLRRGGGMVIVGMTASGLSASYDPLALAFEGKRIIGCRMGNSHIKSDIPRLVELYDDGRLELDGLISGRYPLSEVNEAMTAVTRGDALRNVVVF